MPEVERIRISALPDATSVSNDDELPIIQGGRTKRASVAEVLANAPVTPPLWADCASAINNSYSGWTYANGTAGVGATLTAPTNGGTYTEDGVSLTTGVRVFVRSEAPQYRNGLYVFTAGTVSTPAVLTRHTLMDTADEFDGAVVTILSGTKWSGKQFIIARVAGRVVGTTSVFPSEQKLTPAGGQGDVQLYQDYNLYALSGAQAWTRVRGTGFDYENFLIADVSNQRGDTGDGIYSDIATATADSGKYAGTTFDPATGEYDIFGTGDIALSSAASVFVQDTEFQVDGTIDGGSFLFNVDGSGQLANGNIAWDTLGALTALNHTNTYNGSFVAKNASGFAYGAAIEGKLQNGHTVVYMAMNDAGGGRLEICQPNSDAQISMDATYGIIIGRGQALNNQLAFSQYDHVFERDVGIAWAQAQTIAVTQGDSAGYGDLIVRTYFGDGSNITNISPGNINTLNGFSFDGSGAYNLSWSNISGAPMSYSSDWYMSGNLRMSGNSFYTNSLQDDGAGVITSNSPFSSNIFYEGMYDLGSVAGDAYFTAGVDGYTAALVGDSTFHLEYTSPPYGKLATVTLFLTGDGGSTPTFVCSGTVSFGDAGAPGVLPANVTIFSFMTYDGGGNWRGTYIGGFA